MSPRSPRRRSRITAMLHIAALPSRPNSSSDGQQLRRDPYRRYLTHHPGRESGWCHRCPSGRWEDVASQCPATNVFALMFDDSRRTGESMFGTRALKLATSATFSAILCFTLAAGTQSAAGASEQNSDAAGISKCDAGKICVFTGRSFTGTKFSYSAVPPGTCRSTPAPYRSIINRTGSSQVLFWNANCTGLDLIAAPGGASRDIGTRRSIGAY